MNSETEIQPLHRLGLVRLRVARRDCEQAAEQLAAADVSPFTESDFSSYRIGPDQWILVSCARESNLIISQCVRVLDGFPHHAVDYSSALAGYRLSGAGARELLASGTGLDLRAASFPYGSCTRTRLAEIPVILASPRTGEMDVWADRAFGAWLRAWLEDACEVRRRASGASDPPAFS